MKNNIYKGISMICAGMLTASVLCMTAFAADEPITIDAPVTNALEASYVFTNEIDNTDEAVSNVSFDISITMPMTGETSWNDYCTCCVLVNDAEGAHGYQFGGSAVGWTSDIDEDGNDDTMAGVGTETWLGTVKAGAITINVPVSAAAGEAYSISFYARCWENYTEPIYTVNSAIVNGEAEETVTTEAPTTVAPTEAVTDAPKETSAETKADETTTAAKTDDTDKSFPTGGYIGIGGGVVLATAIITTSIVLSKKKKAEETK